MSAEKIILTIDNLTVSYSTETTYLEALREVSFQVAQGQTYGVVGESGSGKSTLALAVMRYLAKEGQVRQGKILLEGADLLNLSESALRKVWGAKLAMVPQNPFSSLNPSIKVGEQIAEILRLHMQLDSRTADARTKDLLTMVRLPDPERIADSYPHQLSGGQQQRVIIAMALSTEPRLLVLDEPTTGLDVTTEAAVLELIKDLIIARETSALYVTHNLGVVAGVTDRVAVLYASELVEDGPTDELFAQSLHPYTYGLIDCIPKLGQRKDAVRLKGIPGRIPPLDDLPAGCVFAPRCSIALEQCHQERPSLDRPTEDRSVRCHRWPEILSGEVMLAQPLLHEETPIAQNKEPILRLDNVQVQYPIGRSIMDIVKRKPANAVQAVVGFDLSLKRGTTLGLVGESGSGKTSLARAIIGLEERTGGEMRLMNVALKPGLAQRKQDVLQQLQMVFQNPQEALNPYMTVGESLSRPLMTLLGMSKAEATQQMLVLLDNVRLPANFAERLPAQLSGGEKQRVAIARAFATAPDIILADEPVSALDVSVQANILNLLNAMQAEHQSATIFISHDLSVVAYLADTVAVMYLGHLMELSDADHLFIAPYHPYTEALLAVIPVADPEIEQMPIRLSGDIPSSIDVPTGCPFHTRCPRYYGDICKTEKPDWQESKNGKRIFCHIPLEELIEVQSPAVRRSKGEVN